MLLIALLILFIACSAVLAYKVYKLSQRNIAVATINEQVQQQQKQLEVEIKVKKEDLAQLQQSVEAQNNVVKSLMKTAEEMRERATQDAEQAHQARLKELDIEYNQKLAKATEWLESETQKLTLQQKHLQTKVQMEQDALDDLKAKQAAYLEAKVRETAMQEAKDFFRLALTEEELSDVQALRQIQPSFSRKDSIDKIIWENYYKSAYDLLMGRLNLPASKKVCGIYKITNLDNGLAYIGQSVDIRERWRSHIKAAIEHGQTSNRLYQAMKKYGIDRFSFEILEEVARPALNDREVYWIEFYKTKELGLNSTKGGS